MQFANKQVVLTGASGGIGGELAKLLARQNARLILVGRNKDRLSQIKDELPSGGSVYLVTADITMESGLQRIAAIAAQAGGVDVLINCAGTNEFSLFNDQQDSAIIGMVSTNLIAPMLLTQRLLPQLQNAKEGFIVNIGSTFGSIGHPGFAVYCASKFALRGFSQALRRELTDTSIRVQYIAPRATRTDINSAAVGSMNAALKVNMDDPRDVAIQILEAMTRGKKHEIHLGWPERLFARINQILPSVVDGVMRKQLNTIKHFASEADLTEGRKAIPLQRRGQ